MITVKIDRYYKNPFIMDNSDIYGQIRFVGFESLEYDGLDLSQAGNIINLKVNGKKIVLNNVKLNKAYIA